MMLAGEFYDAESFTTSGDPGSLLECTLVARLNPGNGIFLGHFPGNPVVPGVCQVQMIRETIARALGTDLVLRESDNIKFLAVIDPRATPVIEIAAVIRPDEGRRIPVTATIRAGESVFLKFKGIFEPITTCQKNSS